MIIDPFSLSLCLIIIDFNTNNNIVNRVGVKKIKIFYNLTANYTV